MPKSLNSMFASKNKTDALKSHNEATLRLFVETLRTLMDKDVLSAEEMKTIFERAVSESSDAEQNYIEQIYDILNPPDEDD